MNNNPNEINMTTVKPDKLTEKAFARSIAVSIFCVVLCAVALCSVTWAWFKGDVTSSDNTIKAGYCNVTIDVKDGDTTVSAHVGTTGVYTFKAGKTYTVTITSEGDVKSSYCKLVIGDNAYYTQQISTHAPGNFISFTLTFDADTVVQILDRWGTYSGEVRDFIDGGNYVNLIAVIDNGGETPDEDSAENGSEVGGELAGDEMETDGETAGN